MSLMKASAGLMGCGCLLIMVPVIMLSLLLLAGMISSLVNQ